jgi:hypothetical protein
VNGGVEDAECNVSEAAPFPQPEVRTMGNNRHQRLTKILVLMLAALSTAAPAPKAATPSNYSADIHFDIAKVPFSRYGSYLALSHLASAAALPEGLYLRTVHGAVPRREVFQIELIQSGKPVSFREIASPTLLRLEAAEGVAEIFFSDPHVIRVRGRGVELRLSAPNGAGGSAYAAGDGRWEVNCPAQDVKFMLVGLAGTLTVDAPWSGTSSDQTRASFVPNPQTGQFEGAAEIFEGSWHPRSFAQNFDNSLQALQREYADWLSKMPSVVPEFQAAANLAAYLNWASVVAPEGHFKRPAMLMSKNWMTNVWSWDHCFNAMALIYKNPEAAWGQFFVVLDNQNADGALPDAENDRSFVWSFSKPPIHGWVAVWMLLHSKDASRPVIERLYGPLANWTDWYFKFRDYDGDGLPQYNHGNDSGWDNASVFRVGPTRGDARPFCLPCAANGCSFPMGRGPRKAAGEPGMEPPRGRTSQ